MVSRIYWTPYFLFMRCLPLFITDDRYCTWALEEKEYFCHLPSVWHLEMSNRYERLYRRSALIYKRGHWNAASSTNSLWILATAWTQNINVFYLSAFSLNTSSSRIPEKVQRCITQQHNGCLCLTQTNSKMALSPDAEIKEQVLVELL